MRLINIKIFGGNILDWSKYEFFDCKMPQPAKRKDNAKIYIIFAFLFGSATIYFYIVLTLYCWCACVCVDFDWITHLWTYLTIFPCPVVRKWRYTFFFFGKRLLSVSITLRGFNTYRERKSGFITKIWIFPVWVYAFNATITAELTLHCERNEWIIKLGMHIIATTTRKENRQIICLI